MKKLWSTLAVAALMTTSALAQEVVDKKPIVSIEIGTTIPLADAKLEESNGKIMTLSEAKTNKGLLVMFSCNTCPYVVKSQARTLEMMKYAQKAGVGMVIINSNEAYREEADSRTKMLQYASAQGYKVPYLMDEGSKVADAFGATRTPEVFLFDGSGKLVYKGAMEDNPATPQESKELYLKNAIDAMLAGKEINPAATKSIGCSIKRAS